MIRLRARVVRRPEPIAGYVQLSESARSVQDRVGRHGLTPTSRPHSRGDLDPRGAVPTLELARVADELGYECLWFGEQQRNAAGSGHQRSPVVVAAAAAAVTRRIRLGFSFLLPPSTIWSGSPGTSRRWTWAPAAAIEARSRSSVLPDRRVRCRSPPARQPLVERLTGQLSRSWPQRVRPGPDDEDLEPERFLRDTALVGSPETVARRVAELRDELGVQYVNLRPSIGGNCPPALQAITVELFATEIMPGLATPRLARGQPVNTGESKKPAPRKPTPRI